MPPAKALLIRNTSTQSTHVVDPPTQQTTFHGETRTRWGIRNLLPHTNIDDDDNSTDDDDDGGGGGGGGGGLGIDDALRTAIAQRMLAPLDIGLGRDADRLLPRDRDDRDRRRPGRPVPPRTGSGETAAVPRPSGQQRPPIVPPWGTTAMPHPPPDWPFAPTATPPAPPKTAVAVILESIK